jgi:hypothetical protein
MLDLTGHMIIWGGLFAHRDGSIGLMKLVFCYALPTVVQGFGTNETLHFWSSVVVHEHWPVSQRMIVEMGDYT